MTYCSARLPRPQRAAQSASLGDLGQVSSLQFGPKNSLRRQAQHESRYVGRGAACRCARFSRFWGDFDLPTDAFFAYICENLSEPLAKARDQVRGGFEDVEEDDYRVDLLHAPEWLCQDDFFRIPIELSHLSASTGQRPQVEKRWLPTMTAAELYDLYRDMHADHEELCSWSSFARAWKDWQTILGIRPPQEHGRCDDCAKYSKYRKLQDNEAELKAVVAAYNRHIKQVLADRHAMQSLEAAVEQAARSPAPLPHLVILIDGMDRSKWLLPRELENSKKMSSLWRPSVHLVGILIPGVLEYMALLEPDVKGDSDTQQTLISRAVQLAMERLTAAGKTLPTRLIIQFDNTTKEGRNSGMLLWTAAMVQAKRFEEITWTLLRVGHTHNRLD